MSLINQFLSLGIQTKLLVLGAGLFIVGMILLSIGGATKGKGKKCAWCGREIQGRMEKCSLCRDKFCSQKCVLEHKQNMYAPGN